MTASPGSSDPMTVRQAAAADTPDILRLINGAFAVERFFVDGDRIDAAGVERCFERGLFLMLDEPGPHPVGCVYIELHGDRGYFGLLSVAPDRQHAGIGRRLVAAAEAHCRAAGCAVMDIKVVNLRTELPPIYRRLGYTESGTAPFTGTAMQPCHFVLMTKPLTGDP